ncbi:MAG: undecaprenyl/decaprenyl-phosphate alpha-N-acetylglucosaminyl 1-phosphate transferase [Verrucomicrobia bacterium]|nr:undecaprenyl/decaprenyl-phosphate alpha-N-acetylglucosaminyl 1-phosphate transferase [Verrucomicrobiota bacterium]
MRTYFTLLVLSAVATFLSTPLVRWLAYRWGALDLPNERKIHTQPMPRLGGLAAYAGFWCPWVGFYILNNRVTEAFRNYEKLSLTLWLGASAMLALGVWDDIKGVRAIKKLVLQCLIAVGLFLGDFRITTLSNPFGAPWQLGWLSLPVSVLWIVGVTNAINLLDGIDGLATGVTACIALALALINVLGGNIIVALLTLCLAGACLGFLPFNFSPARIFLGDSGSLFIGLMLACIGILSLFKAATATFVLAPLILFGLPLFDTVSVAIGRLARGVPLFQADKSHVHHRLLRLGMNQRQAAYLLYSVTLLLGGAAVVLSVLQSPQTLLLGCALVLGLAAIIWRAWRLRLAGPSRPPAA